MRLLTYTVILFVFILDSAASCASEANSVNNGGRDVNNVSFRGDCTTFFMKIEGASFADGAFLVTTMGARFEYAAGELKIYQGLGSDPESKRLLATLTIDGLEKLEKVESNNDHTLLWSEKLNIGIYGDSTCVLAPKEKLSIRFKGNFKPDYEGRFKGELLLIDDSGGMEIYPQRYESGYKAAKIELGRKDWVAEYLLNANERVMIAAFPARPFDWDRSFKSHIVTTYGGMGKGIGNVYGQMPSDNAIRKWSQNLDIIVMFFQGLYKNPDPAGPFLVANESEFRRLVQTAHQCEMKVAPYTSLFYHYRKFKTTESYFEQIKAIQNKYGIDGVYIDGLLFDYYAEENDDKITNWEMIRRLRQLFGPEGVIVYHGTSKGSPVATVPNIDTYCDVTLNGEGVAVKDANDPYVRYQVRKCGISNTVGIWYDAHKSSLNFKDRIEAIIKMNCRLYWGSYVPIKEAPPNNKYIWGTTLDSGYLYYLEKLKEFKEKQQKIQKIY